MNRFLSHYKTKSDLITAKILAYNSTCHKLVITSSSGHTTCNEDLLFQVNNHKEADTLLIYQAVLASQRNQPDAQMVFFSPDTDVLVLAIANYDLMLKNTSISMASGVIRIEPIWTAIVAERAKALPAFHAFIGADNTGRFSRIGKASWLQVYMKAERRNQFSADDFNRGKSNRNYVGHSGQFRLCSQISLWLNLAYLL